MSFPFIPILILGMMTLNWIIQDDHHSLLDYLTKPAVIILMLIWIPLETELTGTIRWFWLGLLFSLGGDILLLVPRQGFLPGLGAFSVTHLCYLVGLISSFPPESQLNYLITLAVTAAGLTLLAITGFFDFRSGDKTYRLPVIIYAGLILSASGAALSLNLTPAWDRESFGLITGGMLLFALSDGLLAWDKFHQPLPRRNFWVRSSYHSAQLLIVVGLIPQSVP